MTISIRQATVADAGDIARIWRERLDVESGPKDGEAFFEERLRTQTSVFRFWVAVAEDGRIVGWASLQPVRNNPALVNTMAEGAQYVARSHRGHNIGEQLLKQAFSSVADSPVEWLLGYIGETNISALVGSMRAGAIVVGRIPAPPKNPSRGAVIVVAHPVGGDLEMATGVLNVPRGGGT